VKKRLAIVLLRALQGVIALVAFALIATVAAGQFSGRSDGCGRVSEARAGIKCIRCALSIYEVDNGGFPSTEQGLAALTVQPEGLGTWKGPYLQGGQILKDPWGNEYVYRRGQQGFDLMSSGPDGVAGTADDLRD